MNELMVIDERTTDWTSYSLESILFGLCEEAHKEAQGIEADERHVRIGLNDLAFEFPELSSVLRYFHNRLATLSNKIPVPDNVDVVSGMGKGFEPDPMAKFMHEQKEKAEQKYVQQQMKTPDGRKLKNLCKEEFRRISLLTHPDRTKDRSLNEVFYQAMALFKDNNYSGLQQLHQNIKDYKKLRLVWKDFRTFVQSKIKEKKGELENLKQKRASFRTSLEWTTVDPDYNKEQRFSAYSTFVGFHVSRLRNEIAVKEQIVRHSGINPFKFDF